MNAILLAAGLFASPVTVTSATSSLDSLFIAQRYEVVQEIRHETQLDLHQQSVQFFAPGGELHRQLASSGTTDARFAAR